MSEFMPSTKFTPSSASTVLDTGGDSNIYTYGAMKYLTSLKNHLTMNLKSFMIRSIFALYPGLTRQGIWAIVNGNTNDRKHEDEIEFIDEKKSLRSMNEDSVIRAAIQEHRAVLGLANRAANISELKKDNERYYRLVLRYFVFLDRELERKAEMKLSEEKMKSGGNERLRFWVSASTSFRCPTSSHVL